MNLLKRVFLISILVITGYSADAQVSIGGNISILKFFGDYSDLSSTGLTLRGDFALREDIAITAGFSYYFPKTYDLTYDLFPVDPMGSYSSVGGEEKYNFMHFYGGIKKYFVGEYNDRNFGFYGELDMGLIISPYSSTVDSYDRSTYREIETTDESFSNFFFGLGIGFEQGFDFGFIFTEAKLNLPANRENGEEVEIEIPGNSIINIGYRYMFD